MSSPSSDSFVHLHVHTDYSALDGAARVQPLVDYVASLGQPAIAITDHGQMSGAHELYEAATSAGITPIIGVEAYCSPAGTSRHDRDPVSLAEPVPVECGKPGATRRHPDDYSGAGAYTHMTLLAASQVGLRNLMRVNSAAHADGWYRKNRIDIDLLSRWAQGIIATTGCPSGEIQTRLRLGDYDGAVAHAAQLRDILDDGNLYVELMDHGLEIEARVAADLRRLARDLGLPLLATNDLHYVTQPEHRWHEAMLALQSGAKLTDPTAEEGGKGRFAFTGDTYYVRTAEEMRTLFAETPEACDNTLLIAERIAAENITFAHRDLMPHFPTPNGEPEADYFTEQVLTGLADRLGGHIPDDYMARARYEIDVITSKGYPGYFLIVADFVQWAKDNGIPTGPGRGCLSGDTRVATPNGFVNIKDIKVGDEVFDETGTAVVVPQVFEYDCDEELVEIKAFYGRDGNKMTADHKVLVSKANRVTDKKKLAGGYRYEPEVLEPEWIRADEVEVGDLVVMPKLQFPETTTGWSFEPVSQCQSNESSPLSARAIARALGLKDRTAVQRFVNKGGDVNSAIADRIRDYLDSLGATVEDCVDARTKTTTASTDFLPASYEAGQFLGMFVSNGWLRSSGQAQVGFAQNRGSDTGYYPQLVRDLFGLELSVSDHATSGLRQYSLNHRGVADLVRSLFPDYEHTAHTKYIPQEFMNAPEEFRLGLLHGLWYGDGCLSGKTVYSTVSERLADDVAMLLLSLGLPAGLKSQTRTDTRPEFAGTRTEYKVTTANLFDPERVHNGGVGYDGRFTYLRVREVNNVPSEGKVYDFTVPGKNSYVTDSYVVHNSVGGAIVAWALRITDVDPIRHGLLFERFLNPERESMPDIDLDFSEARRGDVIDYVRGKYGDDNVTQIATYMVMQPKSALRDAARVLGHDYATGDRLAKAWPDPVMGKNLSFDKGLDPANEQYVDTADFRELVNTKQDYKIVQSLAQRFEGVKRGYGMHAAGIIISPEPVADVVPLMRQNGESPLMTAFDYPTCESLGLVKMDFLGLKTLDTIQYAVEQVRANKGVEVDVPALVEDLADPVTYELLATGDTLGVFQLDSAPMRALLKRMQPDNFEDISAVLALYRPGPMGANAHNDYADRKNGRQAVAPIHPEFAESLSEVLGETHGLIVYQEQVMSIAQVLSGYSLGQADLLRRAMGKKKKEVLDAEFVPFSDGAHANGYSDEAIRAMWDVLVPFSDYAFNKAHSAAYGVISYVTAYLKANFPVEYMAALLTVNASDSTKTSVYLTECRRMGITVASPDVNASGPGYTADGGIVRVGLTGVRNVGDAPAAAIIAERATQPFVSFADFLQRMSGSKANKRVIESLIFAGGFDSLGQHRAQVHAALEPAMKSLQNAKNRAKSKAKRQGTLFDAADVDAIVIDVPDVAMWTKRDTLAKERDMLGMYVSGHPLAGHELTLRALSNTTIADILEGTIDMSGTTVTAAGLITSIEMKKAKKNGKPWAVVTIEDDTAPIEVAVFTHIYPRVKHTLVTDQVVTIEGRLMWKDDEGRLALNPDSVKTADMRAAAIKARSALPYEITISNADLTRNFTGIQQALASHPGTWQVIINVGKQRLQLGDEYRVSPSAALAETLRALGATPTA